MVLHGKGQPAAAAAKPLRPFRDSLVDVCVCVCGIWVFFAGFTGSCAAELQSSESWVLGRFPLVFARFPGHWLRKGVLPCVFVPRGVLATPFYWCSIVLLVIIVLLVDIGFYSFYFHGVSLFCSNGMYRPSRVDWGGFPAEGIVRILSQPEGSFRLQDFLARGKILCTRDFLLHRRPCCALAIPVVFHYPIDYIVSQKSCAGLQVQGVRKYYYSLASR